MSKNYGFTWKTATVSTKNTWYHWGKTYSIIWEKITMWKTTSIIKSTPYYQEKKSLNHSTSPKNCNTTMIQTLTQTWYYHSTKSFYFLHTRNSLNLSVCLREVTCVSPVRSRTVVCSAPLSSVYYTDCSPSSCSGIRQPSRSPRGGSRLSLSSVCRRADRMHARSLWHLTAAARSRSLSLRRGHAPFSSSAYE